MAKKIMLKKALKIIGGLIIFFTLPTLLLLGFLYLKYDEDLPIGQKGAGADQLATTMLNVLNYEAYKTTDYIEWTFRGNHHYKWYKAEKRCEVYWDVFKVDLNLNNIENSKVYVAEQNYNGIEKNDYVQKALAYFNNDSFWLVAPFKVFDSGTERRLVKTEDNKEALLITYKSGGTTPGDSYLWHLDKDGKPTSYQMWVDIIPIGGLEATWENWITTENGIELSTFHKMLAFGIDLNGIKAL